MAISHVFSLILSLNGHFVHFYLLFNVCVFYLFCVLLFLFCIYLCIFTVHLWLFWVESYSCLYVLLLVLCRFVVILSEHAAADHQPAGGSKDQQEPTDSTPRLVLILTSTQIQYRTVPLWTSCVFFKGNTDSLQVFYGCFIWIMWLLFYLTY